MFVMDETNYLAHYGILRKSGRYPYGSGGPERASSKGFLDYVNELKKEGMTETQIADAFGVKTTELRAAKTIARQETRAAKIQRAEQLKAKGYSPSAIAQEMGLPNESSVRSLLSDSSKARNDVLTATAGVLKDSVNEKGYVDIGAGVENHMGVTRTKLQNSVAILKEEGYNVYYVKVPQVATGKETTIKVLAKPDMTYSEVYKNRFDIAHPMYNSDDGGNSYTKPLPPLSISADRVAVKYGDEGGSHADGVMYVRPGVEDVHLGGAAYAQVRVAVNGTHYLKGMAVYKDDLPEGVDIMFNTNKKDTGNKLDAMKGMKDDEANPFGSVTRQITAVGSNGKKKVTSAMNIVNEEGDWDQWGRNLSSQFLSKQSPVLAKAQLAMTHERKRNELDEIMALTNPAVKKKLLEAFADDVDSSAVHLKAASMPRQRTQVILPVSDLKPNEVHAPNFNNGERVALVRYPHGGTFEIPELVVNNNNPAAIKMLGRKTTDAIGINHETAARLSGADFDGDTVIVIPNNSGRVNSTPALAKLKGFEPQVQYRAYDGMKTIDGGYWNEAKRKVEFPEGKKPNPKAKQIAMGEVSNLITDMTIRRASSDELARAVRHSMVVIDAEKHSLDHRRSAQENGISALKAKYQHDPSNPKSKGASTLISRASAEYRVPDRKARPAGEGGAIDPATGKLMYVRTGKTFTNKKGEVVPSKIKSTKLAETDDARTLSSGTVIERVYADHSNRLKSLANEARMAYVRTNPTPYSKSAKVAYATEVKSLQAKLHIAQRNAPLERQAQLVANRIIQAKKAANPNMDSADLKKVKANALNEARLRTGAGKIRVEITPSEWSAIQAGAISTTRLNEILTNSDLEVVKTLATPRTQHLMSPTRISRAKQMSDAGYTQAEIASQLGVSLTTLKEGLK